MQQAPAWLPYGLRTRIDQWRVHHALRSIRQTRPYPLNDPSDADAELHMLLCKRDLRLGVVCLKSLLRFDAGIRFCATILSDGTLTDADRAWFDHHIPNARWSSRPRKGDDRPSEVQAALAPWPHLSSLYHDSDFELIAKIIHPLLLGRHERIILLDADEAFFDVPERLMAFCRGDDAAPLYLHDHQNEAKGVDPQAIEAFASLGQAMTSAGHPWRMPRYYFNSGLLAYRRDQLNLAAAECYLAWREQAPADDRTGRLGIWFGDWTREQSAYLAMYAAADSPGEPLGPEYHLGGAPGHVFNHFLRHYVVRRRIHGRLQALIRTL